MIYADDAAILRELAQWRTDGRKAALAMVVATWGSSPRPAGSLLAVNDQGAMVGSVSGGCIEGVVVLEAQEVMQSSRPKTLSFGVSNEDAWSVGLACGGRVQIYLEPVQ